MKLLPLALIGLLSGAASSVITLRLASPEPAAAQLPAAPSSDSALARIEEQLAGLMKQQESLTADITGLQARAEPQSERLPVGEIEAAVDRALAQRAMQGPGSNGNDPSPQDDLGPELEMDAVVATLLADDFESGLDRETFWQEVRDAGLIDQVIEAFEERAAADPNNPDVQVDLGEVYLQKIFEVGQGPLAGVFASRADEAFNDALAIDENHWEARFTKATSLSFWPPVFGKQAEAIQQYEILAEQQESEAPREEFAQTYLLLGNLYQQSGKIEEAREAWRTGLDQFPDNQALIDQIEVSQD